MTDSRITEVCTCEVSPYTATDWPLHGIYCRLHQDYRREAEAIAERVARESEEYRIAAGRR